MSVIIMDSSLWVANKSQRCRAHNGQIREGAECTLIKLSINSEGPFRVPVCRQCAALEDDALIGDMIIEARRHNATGKVMSEYSRLMAREKHK